VTTTFHPGPLRGEIAVPGDKSISHRALIIATKSSTPVAISNLNPGRDVAATRAALEALGAHIDVDGAVVNVSSARLRDPSAPLDCENSGSTARMLMGVCSGANLRATFIGDDSLSGRPMEPAAAQLRAFGATIETRDGRLPLTLRGTASPQTRDFILLSPSAQIKSALLFAGLFGETAITISGDRGSRDHTERLLADFGAAIAFDGRTVRYEPGPLGCDALRMPGDFSAAAFFLVAATIAPGSALVIRDVGVNPARTGLLDVLLSMGARIEQRNERAWGSEPVADLYVESSELRGTAVGPQTAQRAIDEILVLAVAAARASGATRVSGVRALRDKESDRLAGIERILSRVDVKVEALPNGIVIHGGPGGSGSGTVATAGDHRTAMAVAALATAAGPLSIDDGASIAVSFPDFLATLQKAQR